MILLRIVAFGAVLSCALYALMPEAMAMMQRDPVLGYWLTDAHDGVIELYPCVGRSELVCGRFHWLKDDDPQNVSRDDKNPDPAKRKRPMCQMQFMGDFQPTHDGHYEGGWIYSPQSGWIYSAQMTLMNFGTLDLHGYVLTPLLGESRIWTRTRFKPVCVTDKL